jgi:hypothetical protein
MGSRRLLGRRVRNQAACRSSSDLSTGNGITLYAHSRARLQKDYFEKVG